MFDSSLSGMAEFRSRIVDSDEVAELWAAYNNRETEGVNVPETYRLTEPILLLFENYQRADYARQYGVL